MKNRAVAFWLGTAAILVAIGLTRRVSLIGAFLGYAVGFILTKWLYHDTKLSVQLDTIAAIKKMRRGFFARLGAVTLVVTGVARYQAGWLLGLTVGLAVGVLVSLFLTVHVQNSERKEG